MKVVVLTEIWKRHKLFNIFINGFNRIKRNTEHELILVTVGSEGINFSKNHIEHRNIPLSNKWQAGLKYAKSFNPDYVLMLGSDDLICSNLLDVYTYEMEKGIDLIGLTDCYFLDSRDLKFNYWVGYRNHRIGESIGMARMLSKNILDKTNWNIWRNTINKGLDNEMMKTLRAVGFSEKIFNCKKEKIMALDVKSNINISNIKTYKDLIEEDIKNLSNFIGNDEFEKLKKLN